MDHDFSTNPLCKCEFLLKPQMIYILVDREKGTMKFWRAKLLTLEMVLTMFAMLNANQQMLRYLQMFHMSMPERPSKIKSSCY